MDHIPRLSESVYVGLCRKLGSPTEVRIRREVMDTLEVVNKPLYIMRGLDRIQSGSRREGFRLRTSDDDWMFWLPDHKVICDLSQISLYRIQENTMILMNCNNLPPGFTRLYLMSPSNNVQTVFSCVVLNYSVFISSALFRNNHLIYTKMNTISSAFPHGPCCTFSVSKGIETDQAFCFQSHHWPTSALPWIQRCRQQGWPAQNVVSEILSGGFHVVPIGSTPDNGLEWRISFSIAEQKLIYSMNHCQFLCYGLLKIFLKEVINCQTSTQIICSYFLKTILFWTIHKNTSLIWTPDNLLSCFWICFKLLINNVRTGECPNFFIPQNNMFRVKVTGSAQTSLFSQLYDLYGKGISCLLLSETIRPYLCRAILNRTFRVCTDESSIASSTYLDAVLFSELPLFNLCIERIEEFVVYIKQIEKMIKEGLSSYQPVILQSITSNVLRNAALYVQKNICQNENSSKVFYQAKRGFKMLKQSCKFGCVSDILYLAMYFYRTRRYEDSLSCLHKATERMSMPYIMYLGHVRQHLYLYCLERDTLGSKMRRALVRDIMLQFKYTYIDELSLEQGINKKNEFLSLKIPPFVMLHMLFILNHHKLGNTVRSQQSLQDLQTLLLYDDGVYVPHVFRDISWQILGICQQICGDFSGSLRSYQYALQQEPVFHKIQEATLLRIENLSDRML